MFMVKPLYVIVDENMIKYEKVFPHPFFNIKRASTFKYLLTPAHAHVASFRIDGIKNNEMYWPLNENYNIDLKVLPKELEIRVCGAYLSTTIDKVVDNIKEQGFKNVEVYKKASL